MLTMRNLWYYLEANNGLSNSAEAMELCSMHVSLNTSVKDDHSTVHLKGGEACTRSSSLSRLYEDGE